MISEFRGENYFLSNFYVAPFVYDRVRYQTVEAAFQAAKCINPGDRIQFAGLEPGEAKRLGRKVALRSDWERVKDGIMLELVRAKFSQNPELKIALIATGEEELVEGNNWHDNYWGRCRCPKCCGRSARNQLGKTLMVLRSEFQTGGNEK